MSRRTVRRTYQRALSLVLASTLAASVGAVTALPAFADPAATATDSETTVATSVQQEEAAPSESADTPVGETPEPEEPGFFRGLVQGIAQAFSEPSVTGPAEDSGWEEHLPEDPTGRGWDFVEPITDDYHENYFHIENAQTQVPDLFDFSDADLTSATALDPVEGVRLHVVTTESTPSDIDVEWLTEGVDYLNDRGLEDGVISSASVTIGLEISVESGPERTLRIVAPGARNAQNFCVSAPEVGIVASGFGNVCNFRIPHGVTWTGGRSLTTNVTDDRGTGRGVVPFLTNAGNAVSRPVSFFQHSSGDVYALNGEINTETGEGFFQVALPSSNMNADFIIHAEDFPVGTRFSYKEQVVERTVDTSDLTFRGVSVVRVHPSISLTRIGFQIPEDYLPSGSVSEAGRYDIGFSLVNAAALVIPQGGYANQWFLGPDSKLLYNIGDGTDYGSFEDKGTLTTQRGLSAARSVGGFVNNNWARVSWVEPVRIKGSTSKELLAPRHGAYGSNYYVTEYSAVAAPTARYFRSSGNGYLARHAGGARLAAKATPGINYITGLYAESSRVAHDMEMFSVVTYQAETYGSDGVGVGDTIAVCDVWDTYDYHYDDSRDMLVPDDVGVYYSTSPRVTQGSTPGSNSRTAQCGDYSDTSVWSTDKPEDMSSVTGVVTTLAITEELLEDSGDVVTLYAGTPVVVPPYFEGGPVAGDTLPDWYASTTGTEFGTTQVANATIVTPNADPMVTHSHSRSPSGSRMRGASVSYTLTTRLHDAHHPHLTGPLIVTDTLPRCLEAVTVSEETLAYYEITAWRNKGEAVCGDDSSPQEEIELTLRPGVEVESNQTLDYHVGDRYSITVPPVDLTATISRTAPNQSLTNDSSARYVRAEGSPVSPYRYRTTLPLQWVADTGLVKTVEQATIEPGEPVTWTLSAINETSSKAGDTTFIDIFPHDGIAWDETILGETWGNDFDGALNITDVRVVYGAGDGVDVRYTSYDPTLLDPNNPHQEGVDWVSDVSAIGGYDNVTAIKVFIPNFGDEGSEIVQVRVTAVPENMVGGESIVNKLSRGHAANINLDLPDPQPVRTDVVTSTISGTVWNDENRDAFLDSGERGLVETEVTLCRLDDGPGARGPWTQTTGEDGIYTFEGLNSGNYKVSLNGCEATEESAVPDGFPMSHRDTFEQTFSYANRSFEDAVVVANVVLGKNATVNQVNFGFYSMDDARGIAFALPDTGDGSALWVLLLLTGGAAAGVVVFLVRRHRTAGDYLPEEAVMD